MPNPDRPTPRAPQGLARVGRTPSQRALLLALGGALAFLLGRWTGPAEAPALRAPRVAKDMPDSVHGMPLVLDGDTLDFDGLRVRIFGIDAFERDQLCEYDDGTRYGCGQLARESMVSAIDSGVVTCAKRDIDPYGRMVGVCQVRDLDVGRRVVEEGYALAYRHYSNDYVDAEDGARQARRGVWNGRFEAPWDYRHGGAGKQVR